MNDRSVTSPVAPALSAPSFVESVSWLGSVLTRTSPATSTGRDGTMQRLPPFVTRTGRGMTDLVLRGGNFAGCARKSSGDARHKRRATKRRLFGRDKGGRFPTGATASPPCEAPRG